METKKPKRKMSEKQLEVLRLAREKRRRQQAEQREAKKALMEQKPTPEETPEETPEPPEPSPEPVLESEGKPRKQPKKKVKQTVAEESDEENTYVRPTTPNDYPKKPKRKKRNIVEESDSEPEEQIIVVKRRKKPNIRYIYEDDLQQAPVQSQEQYRPQPKSIQRGNRNQSGLDALAQYGFSF